MSKSSDIVPPCTSCGACCALPWKVHVYPEDDVPTELVLDGQQMKHKADGSCIAWDAETKRCTIYERRPRVCRDFTRGTERCIRVVKEHLPKA